jgi:CHAD domain-containing protein
MDAAIAQADALRLAPDLSVGDGLREMLAGALGALRRHPPASAKVPNAETVHRLRIGLRRLRSILSAFGDVLPERERRALDDRLSALAQRYGRTREWDVFLARTVAHLRQAMPEAEDALAVVQQAAEEARQRALPPGDSVKSTLAAVEATIEEVPWLRRPLPSLASSWDNPLPDYAASLLGHRDRRLRKRMKRVDLADRDSFHKLRVRVKKLRYPAELLKTLFDQELASDYLKRLVRVQDALGLLNDALTARALVEELELPPATRLLIAGWSAHEVEACRERFPRAGRAFRHAQVFWED